MIYREPADRKIYKEIGNLKLPMDLYEPCEYKDNACVVLCIHGGGWTTGIKDNNTEWDGGMLRFQASRFAQLGHVGISISYRNIKNKDTDILDLVDDCGDAVRYIKNMDLCRNKKLIIFGESAGGHLAAMLGISDNDEIRPDAVIAVNPVLDCAKGDFVYVSENEGHRVLASPVYRNINKASKFFFIHGTADTVVPIIDTRIMHQKLINSGFESKLSEIDNEQHAFIIYNYRNEEAKIDRLMKPIEEYCERI